MNKVLEKHFKYAEKILKLYPRREEFGVQEKLIEICQNMISFSADAAKAFQESTNTDNEVIKHFQEAIDKATPLANGNDGVATVMKRIIEDSKKRIEDELKKTPIAWDEHNGLVHVGFEKLYQIYLSIEAYDDAIKLAQKAKEEYWRGDWDKRIEKVKRLKSKAE